MLEEVEVDGNVHDEVEGGFKTQHFPSGPPFYPSQSPPATVV